MVEKDWYCQFWVSIDFNMCVTIRVELKAISNDFGGYINYVFQNLESKSWDDKYITVIRFPHWESVFPKIGDVGYLSFKEVIAGEDMWWDKNMNQKIAYNYDNIIFLDFIKEVPKAEQIIL